MTVNMVADHLIIVVLSVLFTIIVGVPLGICAYMFSSVRKALLTIVEILQTIPVMALLGIIMIFAGAGKPTVITGLILYSLLPVVQNTYIGLSEIDPAIKEVARGMGMTRAYRLVNVELPIAFPLIFAGIRIATVTAVGIAVFSSSFGGGGLGGVIVRAIRIGNMQSILASTLALMAMAVIIDTVMAIIERKLRYGPRRTSTRKEG